MVLSAKQKVEFTARLQECADAMARCGNPTDAAKFLNWNPNTFTSRWATVQYLGIKSKYKAPPAKKEAAPKIDLLAQIPKVLRKKGATLKELAQRFGAPIEAIRKTITDLRDNGVSIHEVADRWEITSPQSAYVHGPAVEFTSRPDNTFLFGCTSDNHLCNKNSRLDVLNDLYDRFAKAKVQAVLNAGNWIDGEARFNKHELLVHGMDNQLAYLAENYPQRKGIKTYAVSGDDHEGWYAQREGVDIGRYAEMKMTDAGRDDWVDLGYMESHIRLVNHKTGLASILAVVHPGGGSAYAISYTVQKIVESLDGGEKPAVGLYGHYHKLMCANVRNVWAVQTGCTEDQTTFMRKKKIDAHVGGLILGLEQDPNTGAIIGCTPQMFRYFVKGYYQNRWNLAGNVSHAERGV